MGEKWAPKNGAHLFFLKKMGDPKKKKRWAKKWATKIKIEYLKKVKENVPWSQKYHPSVATGRPKKKKDGRSMGNVPKCAHQKK